MHLTPQIDAMQRIFLSHYSSVAFLHSLLYELVYRMILLCQECSSAVVSVTALLYSSTWIS